MKRFGWAVLGVLFLHAMLAAAAFAGSELPPPSGDVITPPGGNVVHPPGGTAFTGAGTNIPLWAVLAAALLVVGVTLLVASRRRATEAG